ncbi:cAMP-dependent protein kinase inhibitor gamma isoform X2 [Gallus gallus]|uniref:cAMP-dependent protein kinase inhibitor gamma isoform X2 n=1 Tax=Gallus gallus TaxID=9031 RepID=UPI000739BE9E|nr:cAMP-dependent protein kinase inhibitor gamma isoform X2 [Gallus gallus]XP_046758791.1 cAMP-dependent protein kinase inhibitor gamma isoform X2 [Gallus gallus]XP_046786626.1 cAMP-dependent protein kinase inhibitor gamma isoform X2 [Gallus gallus]XP_046786627.1 cAMP-dependent protein kinase inhibitor gamma isoform X2 [Gallus gallus]|eukprot:XP_015151850.1 cAMP-dependent protein kinase inhibitor gamma isoform X2 [Gallus gallus]
MSKQDLKAPFTVSCHLCHRELNRISSDTKVFCSLCKTRLETEQNSEENVRAGRRNAVHDIQRDANTISMRKLTKDISELGVEGAESEEASTSSECDPAARPKEQESKPSP